MNEPGTEWIDNSVRYVATEAYGIEGTTGYFAYLPGSFTYDKQEGFIQWVGMPRAWGDKVPERINFCGIYNIGKDEGMSSGDLY